MTQDNASLYDRFLGYIPLNRFFERNAFPPLLVAFLVTAFIFILFNIIGGIAMVILMWKEFMQLFSNNPASAQLKLNQLMINLPNQMLMGNTIGMWFGLGLPIFWIAARHSSEIKAYLRLKPVNLSVLGLAALGWVMLFPLVGFLSQINEFIPVPHWMQLMEESRAELMQPRFFQKVNPILLFLGIALTPAICEELMFRGYLQRQFDRALPAVVAVVVCGILFGAYHLSIKQILPLSGIGIYLCWLTYRTGSIYPAMLVHLLNNGFAAAMGLAFANKKGVDLEKVGNVDLPILQMLPLVLLVIYLFIHWDKWLARFAGFWQSQPITTPEPHTEPF